MFFPKTYKSYAYVFVSWNLDEYILYLWRGCFQGIYVGVGYIYEGVGYIYEGVVLIFKPN